VWGITASIVFLQLAILSDDILLMLKRTFTNASEIKGSIVYLFSHDDSMSLSLCIGDLENVFIPQILILTL
jgi:hypothetical protein